MWLRYRVSLLDAADAMGETMRLLAGLVVHPFEKSPA